MNFMSSIPAIALVLLLALANNSCGKEKDDGGGQSYNFSSSATSKVMSSSLSASSALIDSVTSLLAGTDEDCGGWYCHTPVELTGKYYSVALDIQSPAGAMSAFFSTAADSHEASVEWKAMNGLSEALEFDFRTPVTHTGDLVCCIGDGALTETEEETNEGDSSYIASIQYLFAYFDATFNIQGDYAADELKGLHTVRFILAADSVTGAKRGDLMYKDPDDDTFKWVDSNGNFQTTRPSNPVTMDDAVVNWSNPYRGNEEIPIVSTNSAPAGGNSVETITQEGLETKGRTYSFDFPAKDFIRFWTVTTTDSGVQIRSIKDLLEEISFAGAPRDGSTYDEGNFGSAGDTVVTVSES